MSSEALARPRPPGSGDGSGKKSFLKMVSCIIRPEKLEAIVTQFKEISLVGGITITIVRGHGRQRSTTEHYMGLPYKIRMHDKIRLDMVVEHSEVDEVVDSLSRLTRTGRVGDGKIFVTDVLAAQRIRTGEKGADAL
jgi:nitrogen regulatory protein PII